MVCNWEQSKKLKELGVPQSGVLEWVETSDSNNIFTPSLELLPKGSSVKAEKRVFFGVLNARVQSASAFTVYELGKMINWDYVSVSPPYLEDKNWSFFTEEKDFTNECEAIGRADVLIYLIEQKIVNVSDIKI